MDSLIQKANPDIAIMSLEESLRNANYDSAAFGVKEVRDKVADIIRANPDTTFYVTNRAVYTVELLAAIIACDRSIITNVLLPSAYLGLSTSDPRHKWGFKDFRNVMYLEQGEIDVLERYVTKTGIKQSASHVGSSIGPILSGRPRPIRIVEERIYWHRLENYARNRAVVLFREWTIIGLANAIDSVLDDQETRNHIKSIVVDRGFIMAAVIEFIVGQQIFDKVHGQIRKLTKGEIKEFNAFVDKMSILSWAN